MKALAVTASMLLLAGGEAWAAKRHDITNKSCEQIQALLRAEGSALLVTRSKRNQGPRYGLFVSDPGACKGFQQAGKRRVGSTTGTCFVWQCGDAGRSQSR